jgi:glucosylceramidase
MMICRDVSFQLRRIFKETMSQSGKTVMDGNSMSMRRLAGVLAAILVAVISGMPENAPQSVLWISTTEQNPWEDRGEVALTDWDDDLTRYIEIDEGTTCQEIDGWGGAINEHGWVAMAVLSQEEREKVLKALFDTSECAVNIGRISMGANDFSSTLYSCNDSPGDYSMSNFTLAADKVNVIPFALAAKSVNPEITFWGAPHSPPAWMKDNGSMIDGSLKTDDATREAYALYFQKWVEGMEAEGIHIYAVHIQNEPNISGNGYPACLMSGAEMGTLIKEYIGPRFRENGLSTEIWAGTLHSSNPGYQSFYPEYIPPTLGDPEAGRYISGVGMQWNALLYAHEVVENYPAVKTMQTETQCGNFYWMPEYSAGTAPNDWAYGVFTFHRMVQWLRAGVNSYCQWNMVLDENGISNSITNPWPQNSMISVDQSSKEVRYNPQFYAVKHFSRYVKRGAARIAAAGNYSEGGSNLLSENIGEAVTDGDMMAFRNPDGDKVLVVRNSTDEEREVAVRMGSWKFKPAVPANSMNTFLVRDPVAVVNEPAHAARSRNVSVRHNSGTVQFAVSGLNGSTSGYVSLSIMDALGRRVATMREPARNDRISIVWNGRNSLGEKAGPGLYFALILMGKDTVICKCPVY